MEGSTTEQREFIPYPTNRVVGTIADATSARAAIDALLQAGFAREDIDILHGEDDVRRLDPTGRRTRVPRAVPANAASHGSSGRGAQASDAPPRRCTCRSIRGHGAREGARQARGGRRIS